MWIDRKPETVAAKIIAKLQLARVTVAKPSQVLLQHFPVLQ